MRVLSTILILLICYPAFSQNEFGVRVAASRVKLRGDQFSYDDLAMRARAGLRVGTYYQMTLAEDVRIQLGVSYMEYKGTLQTLDTLYTIGNLPGGPPGRTSILVETEWRDSLDLTLRAFEIPITLNVISENNHWEFGSGLVASIPFEATSRDADQEENVVDEFAAINVSILFGVSYVVPMGRHSLKAGLTYAQGLLNITKNNAETVEEFSRIKPTSINLGIVWAYKTKKP